MLAFSFPVITVYKVGLELSNPFSLAKLLRPFNSTFWNFLSRNFQGCCLLFNYQGSLLLFLATAILDYHISHRLSTTFLIFFLQSVITFLCRKLCRIPATFIDIITFFFQSQPLFLLSLSWSLTHPTAQLDYHICHFLSTHISNFFNYFFYLSNCTSFRRILTAKTH